MSKQYTAEQLADVLDKHGKWLRGEEDGMCADLSGADLSRADLGGADLRSANLSGANLIDANLSGADLNGANLHHVSLSYANLCNANLRCAELSGANLRYADLSYADLSDANLSRADLGRADLSRADLSRADLSDAYLYVSAAGDIRGIQLLVLYLTKHRIVYRGDTRTVQIGGKRHTLAHWLENYAEIGRSSAYSDSDIALYGNALRLIAQAASPPTRETNTNG